MDFPFAVGLIEPTDFVIMGHPSWSLRAQNVAELQIAADCPGPAELAKLFLQQLDTVYLFGLSDKIVFARPPARPLEHCHRTQIPRRRRWRRHLPL